MEAMLARRPSLPGACLLLAAFASAPACLLDVSPYADTGGAGLQGGGGGGGEGGATTTAGAGASSSTNDSGAGGPGGSIGGNGGTGGAGASGGGGNGGTGAAGGGGAGGGDPIGDKCPGAPTSIDVYQTVTLSGDTGLAAADYGSGVCGGGEAPDLVYEVSVKGKGQHSMALTAGPEYAGFIHVRKVCGDPNSEVKCHDQNVRLEVEPGDVLYVFVDGHAPQVSGTFDLQLYLDGCGNGLIELAEECDDGNKVLGDGCNGECKVTCTSEGSGTTDFKVYLDPETLHCYMLSYAPNKNWANAQADCVAWHGNLAALSTQAELNKVLPLLSDIGEDVWIGGNDMAVDGQFVWTNGEPWIYVNGQLPWNDPIGPAEPNGGTNENCVEIYKSGRLNDESCNNSQNWLCERPPPGALPPVP